MVDSRPVQCCISGSALTLADLRWLVAACAAYDGDSTVEVVAGIGLDGYRSPDTVTVYAPPEAGGQHGGAAGDPAAR